MFLNNNNDNVMFGVLVMLAWIAGISMMGNTAAVILQTYAIAVYLSTFLMLIGVLIFRSLQSSIYYQILLKTCCILSIFLLGQSYANHALEQRLNQRYLTSETVTGVVYVKHISKGDDTVKDQRIQQPVMFVESTEHQPRKMIAYINPDQPLQLGHYYMIQANIKPAHSYAIPHTFDIEKWWLQQNISGAIQIQSIKEMTDIELIAAGYGTFVDSQTGTLQRLLLHIEQKRLHFRTWLKQQPLAQKGLILALLTGDESLLSDETKSLFKQLGISHLLAISGPHVLIFALLVSLILSAVLTRYFTNVFKLIPRPYLMVIPFCCCVIAYTAFVGFEIPALRTCFTVLLLSVVVLLKQRVDALQLILLSAVVLVWFDPFSVLSAAFWLSYVACFILIRVYQTMIHQQPDTQAGYTGASSISISFQQKVYQYLKVLFETQWKVFLALLPLSILIFQQISMIAPVVNIVSIPIIGGVIVPVEVIGAILSGWIEPLGLLFFHLADFCMSGLLGFLTALQSTFQPQLQWWALVPIQVLMIALAVIILFLPSGVITKSWAAICLIPMVVPKHSHDFELNILDVGQGQAIHLQVGTQNILMDTGGYYDEHKFSVAERLMIPYLKARGIAQIDQIILSHLDQDHAGAFQGISKQHEVKAVYSNERDQRFSGMNFEYCHAGQSWHIEDVKISILSPLPSDLKYVSDDQNEYSCVIYVQVLNASHLKNYLIMGDAGWQTEYQLMRQYPDLKVDVLVLGHHGSQYSSSYGFLQFLKPRLAIASAGYANRYHHPHSIVQARLAALKIPFINTIQSGTIQFKLNHKGAIERSDYRDSKLWLIRKN